MQYPVHSQHLVKVSAKQKRIEGLLAGVYLILVGKDFHYCRKYLKEYPKEAHLRNIFGEDQKKK